MEPIMLFVALDGQSVELEALTYKILVQYGIIQVNESPLQEITTITQPHVADYFDFYIRSAIKSLPPATLRDVRKQIIALFN